MTNSQKTVGIFSLLPLFLAFFVMGFVDIVGVSTSYVKQDFALSDTVANLLPMMVFLWFAVCSLPIGVMMGRIGRKNMVICSLALTVVAMVFPLVSYSFPMVLIGFMVLGISNTMLQVSLNPLMVSMVSSDKVTSMITLGNFVKAISSTLGPIIVSVALVRFDNWLLVFWVYALVSVLSFGVLFAVKNDESGALEQNGGFASIIALMKSSKMILVFSVILLSVGFEIGLMTAVPKYLVERCGTTIASASIGCSLYFIGRTAGTFIGSFLFARFNPRKLMIGSVAAGIVFFVLFLTVGNMTVLMGLLLAIGLTCANIFPFTFSYGLQVSGEKVNEASALMIMGVAGGAILPVFMGMIADASSIWASLILPLVTLVYIVSVIYKSLK